MATSSLDYYVPTKRYSHSTHIVGDYLYMWGGDINGFLHVNDTKEKQSMTSVIEIFHLPTGCWKQLPTNGKPPLGVVGYASSVLGNKIYYFGGYCNYDSCWDNGLNSLSTDSLTWNELFQSTSDNGPMMKVDCGMISLTFNKEDYLLVVGGWGPYPTSRKPSAQYIFKDDSVRTNEHHYYQLASGQWIVPDVTGQGPPPCYYFTLIPLPYERAMLFGGNTPNGPDNTVYIGQCTKTAVHWQKISKPLQSMNWPDGRYSHAATIISDLHVLVVGGYPTSDNWLFNINTKTWTKLTLPESVSKRYDHSLSVWNVSSTAVWVIQFGGCLSQNTLNNTTVIELIFSNDKWSVQDVLTNLRSAKEYQLKLLQKSQETSLHTSRRHGKGQFTLQSLTFHQSSSTLHETSKMKDTEVQCLTKKLEFTKKDIQDTKQQEIDVITCLYDDLQTKEQQLQQLLQQLQENQQTQVTLQHQLKDHEKRERLLQEQLQSQEEREQKQLQDSQERENVLHQQLQESINAVQQTQQENATLQQQIQLLQEVSHWVVKKEEIDMTEEIIGKGGWGEVRVAKFRGLRVAAKCLHEVILSPYNITVFTREMEIAARVRHPNLLQFIAATRVGTPIILSELMPTSLRKELEAGPLPYHAVLAISQDIACGLNYLHLFKPHPILHRDVSTANILLTHGQFGWRAKVSDYGSANLQPMIGRTVNPGNPVYSAPEASIPREHSPAMDVYSYGVVLIEMMIRRIPEVAERQLHIDIIQRPMFKALIKRCLKENRRERPTMSEIITDFSDTIC